MKYSYTITGQPAVKKSNQKVVTVRRRLPNGEVRLTRIKVDTPAYKAWHQDAVKQLLAQPRPSTPIDYPVNLQCRFYLASQQRVDLSALYEGIQDVLVELGILADDNYKIVASHDGSGATPDKFAPRLEVTITKKELDPWGM